MFEESETFRCTLDEHLRLRLSVPARLRPLAAWVHTDAQANQQILARLIPGLQAAQQSRTPILGNGWQVEPDEHGVILHSAYLDREPFGVPNTVLWTLLTGLQGLLAESDAALRAQRPEPAEIVPRLVNQDEQGALRDYTYFPPSWSAEMIKQAGQGAWQSPEVLRDWDTGVWSGFWQGREIAGYFHPDSGEVLTYFPVVSPLQRIPEPVG
ncbi:EndoU domain-containing protein [Sciscionella marina]|uniref:EndoU domain-containing protein n=1 Tax=Sciscionella marina TaxID=508770 RepID=UPI000374C491|nr:EndoU domain-containing protein [Sciscionella marina]